MDIRVLKEIGEKIPDPRRQYGYLLHKMVDIIVIGLLTVLCKGQDFDDMEVFGKERHTWLKGFLELPHGIPDSETFRRVYERLKPEALQDCLNQWLAAEREVHEGDIKGTADEKTIYYHHVLEAKIVLGDDFIVSIATEFIENPRESPTKQDCETKAFKRLAESLKKMFPKLPICLLADSLYASEPVFTICQKNKWEFLIHYKEGSIPTLAEEYQEIKDMGESEEETVIVEEIYKRKPRVQAIHKMKWVNDLEYQGHKVGVMELEILIEDKKRKAFQWITSMKITHRQASEFAETGRKRWMVENEGFNIQKNIRYFITHANSLNYNAMKNHYLLTQLADVLLQLYERGVKGLRTMRRTLKDISAGLLECLRNLAITSDDLDFERMQVRKEHVDCG